MWQKLQRIDVNSLENTRIQLHKSMQLLSAAARSYLPPDKDDDNAMLFWDPHESVLHSKNFGTDKATYVSLDPAQYILTLDNKKMGKEHLVLSGMTYPLAYGWLQIKLEKYGFDPDLFNDHTPYELTEYGFDHNKELNIQENASLEIVKMLNNAFDLFRNFHKNEAERIVCRPDHFTLDTRICLDEKISVKIGFCPGDEDYIEPYFFVTKNIAQPFPVNVPELQQGLWHKKDWFGAVLMISNVINVDDEKEFYNLSHFIKSTVEVIKGL